MTRQHGLSVVEIMIAAALTTLLTAAALSLIARGGSARAARESRAELEENVRAALDLLADDIRHAGYLGLASPGTAVAGSSRLGTPETAGLGVAGGCVPSLALDLDVSIGGADGAYGAAPGVAMGCAPSPNGQSVRGSDTLILRHATADDSRPEAGRLQLETRRGGARLFADGRLEFSTPSRVHDLAVHAYYVSSGSTAARGQPSLRRKRLVGGSRPAFQDEELLAGIADLQVEAGVDALGDGDELVDRYVDLGSVPVGSRVRELRIWVLAENNGAGAAPAARPALVYANRTLPADQSRRRRLLAARTIQLRNAGASP